MRKAHADDLQYAEFIDATEPQPEFRTLYQNGQRVPLMVIKMSGRWRDREILAAIHGWAGRYPSSRHV
jgi:hypothetical protein